MRGEHGGAREGSEPYRIERFRGGAVAVWSESGKTSGTTMTDRSYLLRRAAQERQAATEATHPKAQQAHLELASQYEQRSEAGQEQN